MQKTTECDNSDSVHFTYFADIITNDKDITNADVVILKITTKIKEAFQWRLNQGPDSYEVITSPIMKK